MSSSADGLKAAQLTKSLAALHDLELSVNTDRIDEGSILLKKINKFNDTLNGLLECGRTMDESSMFAVPIDMLSFLDGEISNPELYQYKLYEETEAQAVAYANRLNYLQVVKAACDEGLQQDQQPENEQKSKLRQQSGTKRSRE